MAKKKPSKKKSAKKPAPAEQWFTALLSGDWYRGVDAAGKGTGVAYMGNGLYLTWSRETAEGFARLAVRASGKGPGSVETFRLKPGLKILDNQSALMTSIRTKLGVGPFERVSDPLFCQLLTEYVKAEGYDGVVDDTPSDGLVIFDPSNVIRSNPMYRRNADENIRKLERELAQTDDPALALQLYHTMKRAGIANAGAIWYAWQVAHMEDVLRRQGVYVTDDMDVIKQDARVYFLWGGTARDVGMFYCRIHGEEQALDDHYMNSEEPILPDLSVPGSSEQVRQAVLNLYESDTLYPLLARHPELGLNRDNLIRCSVLECNLIIKLDTHAIGWEEALTEYISKKRLR